MLLGAYKQSTLLCLNLQEDKPGKFMSGDKLTYGDLRVFVLLGMLKSGFLEGESPDQ